MTETVIEITLRDTHLRSDAGMEIILDPAAGVMIWAEGVRAAVANQIAKDGIIILHSRIFTRPVSTEHEIGGEG